MYATILTTNSFVAISAQEFLVLILAVAWISLVLSSSALMGYRGSKAGKKNKARTIWKDTEREVRRIQLHNVSLVCDTTVELLARAERGEQSTGHYDGGAAATAERASESTPVDSDTSTTTV